MKLLVPTESYPDKYWFYYQHDESPDYLSFLDCKPLVCDKVPSYAMKGKVGLKKLRDYDYLFSDGPSFVSGRLMAAMVQLGLESELQFVRAKVDINDIAYEDYYALNVLKVAPAFDLSKSIYRPLLKSMPDGPKRFSKIVLLEEEPKFDIFRAEEGRTNIVLSDTLAAKLESMLIKGVRFVSQRENI